MNELQALVLALVQGLTEFLPISSSGHLILLPYLTGWPDQGLAFDVAAHLGSLLAVCTYFRRDLVRLSCDWYQSVVRRAPHGDSRLAWAVLWGTVPAALFGLVAHAWIAAALRTPLVIAATTIGFGALLWWADVRGRRRRRVSDIGLRDVIAIGCAQALALIPGTSRSGITMTAALMLGLTREDAARFSFLLSIPIIVLASGHEMLELAGAGEPVAWGLLALVVCGSALSAYICIALFLAFISRLGMWPFALYRFVLGVLLLVLFL